MAVAWGVSCSTITLSSFGFDIQNQNQEACNPPYIDFLLLKSESWKAALNLLYQPHLDQLWMPFLRAGDVPKTLKVTFCLYFAKLFLLLSFYENNSFYLLCNKYLYSRVSSVLSGLSPGVRGWLIKLSKETCKYEHCYFLQSLVQLQVI